jgi:TfoX/Sxy family transcriptional regulator of competence genes
MGPGWAGVTQLAECLLPKQNVAGSNPVSRSIPRQAGAGPLPPTSSPVVARMQIPKPSEADKARFLSIVPDDPRVQVKPMFGNLGAFVNGNMFMGLFGSDIGLRLSPADADALRAAGGGPFGPEGRPMGGYVSLPDASIDMHKSGEWAARALAFIAAKPPKAAKR